jgi:acyl-CoA thioesterase-1
MRAKVGVAVLLLAACGGNDSAAKARAAPVESTTVAAGGATSRAPAPSPTGVPRVLFLGTSLTAGYGLDDPEHDAYPAAIQRIADSVGVKAYVVNAGLSGETSAGALRRADWLLKQKPDVVVIETGANDGLRGLNPDSTAANIRELIERVRAEQPSARLLLVQMEPPTNLGAPYTREFHALFAKVAAAEKVPLAPFLLDHVAGIARLNQGDGIHPTPEGARIAAHNLWPSLEKVLADSPRPNGIQRAPFPSAKP